jgi:pimeloyl-ACP methyl ester carboxylesterase
MVPIPDRYLLGLLVLPLLVGCQACDGKNRPTSENPIHVCQLPGSNLAIAESALQSGARLEECGDPTSVDCYFQAAVLAWPEIEIHINQLGCPGNRAALVYDAALSGLIRAGQDLGRLDYTSGLKIQTGQGSNFVPIQLHGFPWHRREFDRLSPVGEYPLKELNNQYRTGGYGVSAIAFHNSQAGTPFRKKQELSSATILLRPVTKPIYPWGYYFTLDVYDALRIAETTDNEFQTPLKRDLTAPIAYRINSTKRNYLTGFLQPGSTASDEGLIMIEPYQPGKIPIVFVHGLMSDPFTWANIANEIRARPEFVERYQLWAFEYATGEPFLKSAAKLRRQLQEARAFVDPDGIDSALSEMILVGHSMGGLISKLQITQSGNQLWQAVSRYPLEYIATSRETRDALVESFYFEPLPFISRVVFIGTPHAGSPWAKRPVGKIGAKLVEASTTMEERHRQLIQANPGVFSREFVRRVPTSIDLLKPGSPLLQRIYELPFGPTVHTHSIIGCGHRMIGAGDSDSVVPVSSARLRGVESEKLIQAKHGELHQHAEGIAELFRLLTTHLRELELP